MGLQAGDRADVCLAPLALGGGSEGSAGTLEVAVPGRRDGAGEAGEVSVYEASSSLVTGDVVDVETATLSRGPCSEPRGSSAPWLAQRRPPAGEGGSLAWG